jgi:hypothetical protein
MFSYKKFDASCIQINEVVDGRRRGESCGKISF